MSLHAKYEPMMLMSAQAAKTTMVAANARSPSKRMPQTIMRMPAGMDVRAPKRWPFCHAASLFWVHGRRTPKAELRVALGMR